MSRIHPGIILKMDDNVETRKQNKYGSCTVYASLYLGSILVICSMWPLLDTHPRQTPVSNARQKDPSYDGLRHDSSIFSDDGRYFSPALYPQVVDVRNFSHNAAWYAVSAYIDMRPQAYGDTPAVTIVTGGPVAEVRAGANWFARLFILRSGAFVTSLECDRTKYAPPDQHTSIHAAAAVVCKTSGYWQRLQSISDDLGVCIVRSPKKFCDIASIVPVGKPPLYPKYPLPWAQSYLDSDGRRTNQQDEAEKDYHVGKGRIAACVPGVITDQYAPTLRFWLKYYREMGVDTAHIYMHSPGYEFERIAEAIVAEQAAGRSRHLARLVLLPWCMQLGASYRCRKGQPTIPLSGYDEFVASNHGQILAHQDCLFRSLGTFRWAVFVDEWMNTYFRAGQNCSTYTTLLVAVSL